MEGRTEESHEAMKLSSQAILSSKTILYFSISQILSVSSLSSSIVLAILASKSSSMALFCSIWSNRVLNVTMWSGVIGSVYLVTVVILLKVFMM